MRATIKTEHEILSFILGDVLIREFEIENHSTRSIHKVKVWMITLFPEGKSQGHRGFTLNHTFESKTDAWGWFDYHDGDFTNFSLYTPSDYRH